MFYVYAIKSDKDSSWYYGSSDDISRRLDDHNKGRVKSIKNKRPWRLVYTEQFVSRGEARKRENQIKKSGLLRKKIKNDNMAPSSNG